MDECCSVVDVTVICMQITKYLTPPILYDFCVQIVVAEWTNSVLRLCIFLPFLSIAFFRIMKPMKLRQLVNYSETLALFVFYDETIKSAYFWLTYFSFLICLHSKWNLSVECSDVSSLAYAQTQIISTLARS